MSDVSQIVQTSNTEIRDTVREARKCVNDAAANGKDTVNNLRKDLTNVS